jgi:hypothetical protein
MITVAGFMVLKVFTKRLVSGAEGENSVEIPEIIFKSRVSS